MNTELNSTAITAAFLAQGSQKIAMAVLMIALFVVILKLVQKSRKMIVAKAILSEPLSLIYYSMFRWVLIVIFLLIFLQQMGLSLSNLWTMLSAVIAMVAIGFVAVWSVLSNVLSTFLLLIFRPFRIGDDVELVDPVNTTGVGGTVQNINLMFTTLKSENDEETAYIQIPNNMFFQKLLRRKIGKNTYTLEKQIFEEQSLLKEPKENDSN